MMLRHFILAACLLLGLSFATAGNAAKVGESCGGFVGAVCDKGLWCDPFPGQCGWGGAAGVCVKPGQICILPHIPVCGCNGTTYSNDCLRRQKRVAKLHDGACWK